MRLVVDIAKAILGVVVMLVIFLALALALHISGAPAIAICSLCK